MNLRKALVAAALGGAMSLPGAASAITIGGITFTEGAIFETIDLFEGELLNSGGNNNGVIDQLGEQLVGVGIVNRIRDKDTFALLWQNGQNGVELTIYFHSYIASEINGGNIAFTGGVVEIFSDAARNFAPETTQANAINTAKDGNLWLSLTGSSIGANVEGFATTSTLISKADALTGAGISVLGRGLLDVTGGLTKQNFDTNQFCSEPAVEGCDIADKSFTSSGQLAGPTAPWGFFGTGEVQDVAVIPEPGTLALLGAGLMGLGMRRRKVA